MRKLTIEEMGRMDVATFREADKLAVVVVLDNVRSLHNVGAVFRTADAFALHGLCLCGITATPPSAEIHKTALGAEDTVAWTYHADTLEAVIALKREGYKLLAVEQVEGSTSLSDLTLSPNDKVALVMGNEVKGVRQEVIDICDGAIEIPQYGTKHSLNVSVSAGIVMWEVQKALRQGKD
ncbi:MAG: RNA methyltransferase [Alloprevotella sp.]|nr:RNA methyltransferase [Bacteroidales bacterium]MDY3942700.1 RNA methyltransferase [Alloprevotella sp.]